MSASTTTIPKVIQHSFMALANRLSPKNLSCDGELTPEQVDSRYRILMDEWAKLEAIVGRKVSESEVYQFNK
jgi:hypothetical protein